MIHHLQRATRHLIFWSLILLALALTTIRFTLKVIDRYTEDLEHIISQEIAAPVKIGHLGAGMRGFRPELLLKKVQVLASDNTLPPPITIQEIHLSMDLLQSYGHQQLLASSWITLVGAKLSVIRQADGSIGVAGLKASKAEPPVWILHTAQFELLNSQITWLDRLQETTNNAQKPNQSNQPPKQSLVFNNINILLKNAQNGQQHLLNLLVKLPPNYGHSLSISMQLRGNFLAEQGINGLIYIEGDGLQIAKLITASPSLPIKITDGQSHFQLWSYWQHSQLQAITGTSQTPGLTVQKAAEPALKIKQCDNRFNWVKHDDHWSLSVDQIKVNADNLQLDDIKLAMQGSNVGGLPLKSFSIEAPQLDLQQLQHLGNVFGQPLPLGLPAKALQGKIERLSLTLAPEQGHFSVTGNLKNISLAASANLPGFSNVNAHIEGNQQQGSIELEVAKTALELPNIFAKPLPINALKAHINWQQTPADWLITAPEIKLAVPDLSANSKLTLNLNRQTLQPTINLKSSFNGHTDIKSFSRYWPVGLMGKDAAVWLDQAFLKGQVNPRELTLTGKLSEFPFINKQGAFDLLLDFKDIDLHYAAGWEPVRNIDAVVRFYNDSIKIASQKAIVQGANFQQFNIELPSFSSSQYVNVNLTGDPDIRETLQFLKKSPLQANIERLEQAIAPQGKAPLKLSIQVPIVDKLGLKLNGSLQLQNINLSVLPIALPVSKLQGIIGFNEQGIQGGKLKAQTLGDKINIDLSNNPETMLLAIQGHADIIDLQQQFNSSAWDYARGDTDYRVNLRLPNNNRNASLTLNSDLTGIALRLPDNLAKLPRESRPLNVNLELTDSVLLPINLKLGQQISAAALINTKTKKLASANILIGRGELGALPANGGVVNLNVDQCSLADWWNLAASADARANTSVPFFTQINLQAKQLLWEDQPLGKIDLQMHHAALDWDIDVTSNIITGKIIKPSDPSLDKPILLNLKSVNLSQLTQLTTSPAEKPETSRKPLFKVVSDQVLWNGIDIGSLAIETARSANGITLKQISLKNGQGELALSGDWSVNSDKPQTTATGTFTQRKFGGFLARLNITKDIKASDAKIDLNLSWPGAPQNFALEHLAGGVDVNFSSGRILSIEPGFGRLLGFLAFEQWGRRLRLDFSDMLSQGLSFNSIHGHFDLQQGDATTNDLIVDAVPAEINIKGTAHLTEQTMDYRVKVLPKSSAALPIAGTIVDKVVTFSLETLTGTSQAGFLLGTEYKILGQWQNPQVIRQRAHDGLLQKTWDGLTDFSWLRDTPKPKP